ncbi:MAG: TIGR01777 family oxidoreductase [Chitinophaga sp.]|uniref:TIGR01777 family oxidoreductase n=1 Tax=Chitinophaga sp. TaxID=1869181 RepID=UPI0025BE71CA|nr:TIGR01777 family oxidoreductase [Chitinophaga sp.]MBV8255834.1 TIGR01777 family oxidoreductase [Chitinophaga sp.]
MKNKKIVIAGGTGFLGRSLTELWGTDNQIVILSRTAPATDVNATWVPWDGKTVGNWAAELEHTDVLVNLSGRSVNCRYTPANQQEIFDSRSFSTKALGQAVQQLQHPPKLWVNAASATIYRHAEDRPMDEFTGEIADDFSVRVCKLWEKTFNDITLPHTRKVILRIAVSLGWQQGGVMQPYCNLMKWGLGGHQGSGKQRYSWVHVADVAGMIDWLAGQPTLDGVFICAAPNPVTNTVFMRTLRQQAGHVVGLPAPAWLLEVGAALIGTETELLLKSRWVLPTRALQHGYQFNYPQLDTAIADILDRMPRKAWHLF